MANGDFSRSDLLRRFKNEAGLADASELSDADDLYPKLSDGQLRVTRELAARAYRAFYQAPTAMSSADGGYTFTFGASPVDATKKLLPLGWVQISNSLRAFSGDSFAGWIEGIDYYGEGDRIRIPGNRTYGGTLYARFVPTPPPITALVDPILRPPEVNELTVIAAVEDWAGEGNARPDLVERMQAKWKAKFPLWCQTFKAMHKNSPGSGMVDPNRWWLWSGGDLGGGQGFSS